MLILKVASPLIFRSPTMRKDFWTEFPRTNILSLTTDQLATRAQLAGSWQNWALMSIMTFVGAGLVEETLKYLPVAYARRRRANTREHRRGDRSYIDYAVAGTLSFGLTEMIGFVYTACESGNEGGLKLVLTVFERLVGQVGHLSVAVLTALRATRRDDYGDGLSWLGVVGPAIVLHGTNDFVALAASSLEGNVGWIHPSGLKITSLMMGVYSSVLGLAIGWVRKEWKSLNERDRASGVSPSDKRD